MNYHKEATNNWWNNLTFKEQQEFLTLFKKQIKL